MFAHLHVHSDYSFLDGLMSPKMLVSKAKSVGCEALSLTDHGEISGHIALYDAAVEVGIKPIYGIEAYQAPVSRFDKSPGEHRGHLTLLAMDGQGVHDLWTMSSLSYTDGLYYRPRIDWELLSLYGKRLWVGSACLASFISQAAMADDRTTAKNIADLYRSIVGERFYIEIHTNSMPEQKQVNIWLADFAEREGIPFTFASDVHYCDKGDADVHDALLGVQYKKKFSDADRPHNVPDYYLMSEDEVRDALSYLGDRIVDAAISNTSAIAESIEPFELDTSLKIPVGFVPDSFVPQGLAEDMTVRDEYLVYLCMEGRDKRLKGEDVRDEYDERLAREMDFIIKHGLSDYMLTVARYTRWAKERMLVGPGRGSAAGSLVSYFLGITEIDPIKAGLLFERFLNEGRLGSLPDIDLDFPTHLRHQVKEVLVEWYGDDRVVSIGTVNRMGAKQSLKDAATYLGVDFSDAQRISDFIDTVPNIIELESKKGRGDRREIWDEIVSSIPDRETLASMRAERPRLFEIAEKFYGVARQSSEHAAGVIVSSVPVSTYLPVRVKKGEVVTQFDMHAVERLGFLKADILGLRTLETLQKSRDLVLERRGKYIDFYSFGEAESMDEEVWDMLGRGDTLGVFQAETPGITGVLKKMKPRSIADLSAAIALYRPGILRAEYKDGRNMLDEYLLRGSGEIPVSYLHPSLESILKETHGVIVYQEQVMKICTDLAGYTSVEADNMRCLDKDTMFWTDEGGYRISDLVPKMRLSTLDESIMEVRRNGVRNVFCTGNKECVEVTLADGSSLVCTPDHKFMTASGWVEASDLVGSYVFKDLSRRHGKSTMSHDALFVLSALITEGSLGTRGQCHFSNKDDREMRQFIASYVALSGVAPKTYTDKRGVQRVFVKDEVVESLGLDFTLSGEKALPDSVFSLDDESQRFLLGKMIDFDGYVMHTNGLWKIGYSSKSKTLARQVQMLFNCLGVRASILTKHNNRCDCDYYEVMVLDQRDVSKMGQMLKGFSYKVKKVPCGISAGSKSGRVIPEPIWRPVIENLIAGSGYTRNELCGNDALRSGAGVICPARLRRLLSTCGRSKALESILTNEDISFEKVVSVVPVGVREVWDFSMNSGCLPQAFANGVLVHNSIIGKKKTDKMAEEEKKFIPALVNGGIPEHVAKLLYENIKEFGSYGFNQSHSYSYAVIAFWCAYMKAKYPVEFMAALMDTDPKNIDGYIAECEKLGIRVGPPHVNYSKSTFTITADDELRFGLLGIKWLGDKAALSIMSGAPYSSVDDFLSRNPAGAVNKRNIEALASLRAFSGLSLGGLDVEPSELLRRFVSLGKKVKDEKNVSFWTIPVSSDDDIDRSPFTFHEARKLEMEFLGFCFSVYGFTTFEKRLAESGITVNSGREAEAGEYGRTYRCLCRVVGIRKITTKSKKRMSVIRVTTNDFVDMEIVLFPRMWERCNCHFSVGEVVLVDVEKQKNKAYNDDSFVVVNVMKGTSDEW